MPKDTTRPYLEIIYKLTAQAQLFWRNLSDKTRTDRQYVILRLAGYTFGRQLITVPSNAINGYRILFCFVGLYNFDMQKVLMIGRIGIFFLNVLLPGCLLWPTQGHWYDSLS